MGTWLSRGTVLTLSVLADGAQSQEVGGRSHGRRHQGDPREVGVQRGVRRPRREPRRHGRLVRQGRQEDKARDSRCHPTNHR